jgi:hypothetical protein
MASISAVIPSRLTQPLIQCHQVFGLADSGGVRNPCSSGSAADNLGSAAFKEASVTPSKAAQARDMIFFTIRKLCPPDGSDFWQALGFRFLNFHANPENQQAENTSDVL